MKSAPLPGARKVHGLSTASVARLLATIGIDRLTHAVDPAIATVLTALVGDTRRDPLVRAECGALLATVPGESEQRRFTAQRLVEAAERAAGREAADWDQMVQPAEHPQTASRSNTDGPEDLPARVVYAPHIRSPYNVGAIIRTAAAFGFRAAVFGHASAAPSHARAVRSAMGSQSLVAVKRGDGETARAAAASGGEVAMFALETGGQAIERFAFPASGVIVIGHEVLGVDAETLARCDAGVVRIAHHGAKSSLNVAAAFAAAASWWCAQRTER